MKQKLCIICGDSFRPHCPAQKCCTPKCSAIMRNRHRQDQYRKDREFAKSFREAVGTTQRKRYIHNETPDNNEDKATRAARVAYLEKYYSDKMRLKHLPADEADKKLFKHGKG